MKRASGVIEQNDETEMPTVAFHSLKYTIRRKQFKSNSKAIRKQAKIFF